MSQLPARTETLIAAMARLRELFSQENALLLARDQAGLSALVEHKAVLVRTYDEAAKAFKVDAKGLADLDAGLLGRLREEGRAFAAAADRNALLVRAATRVAQTKVDSLVGAINRTQAEDATYTRRRGMVVPSSQGRATAPSSTLNRTL